MKILRTASLDSNFTGSYKKKSVAWKQETLSLDLTNKKIAT